MGFSEKISAEELEWRLLQCSTASLFPWLQQCWATLGEPCVQYFSGCRSTRRDRTQTGQPCATVHSLAVQPEYSLCIVESRLGRLRFSLWKAGKPCWPGLDWSILQKSPRKVPFPLHCWVEENGASWAWVWFRGKVQLFNFCFQLFNF